MKNTHNLSVLAYANGFALWLFRSKLDEDTFKRSLGSEFAEVSHMLNKNDEIMVITTDDVHLNVAIKSVDKKAKKVNLIFKT